MRLPTWENTQNAIRALGLDDLAEEHRGEIDAVRAQQFAAFEAAAPSLSHADRFELFQRIWDSARVAAIVAQRKLEVLSQAETIRNLQNVGLVPTCNDPACETCRKIDHKLRPVDEKELS